MVDPKHASDEPHVRGDFDQELSISALMWFMGAIVAITIAAFVGMWYMGLAMRDNLAVGDTPAPQVAESPHDLLPPEPRLQTKSYEDWASMKAAHEEHLTTYAWVDQGQGQVRIPIEDAMRRIAEHGLPNFPPAPTAEPTGTGN